VVVGGGIVGAACALALAREQLRVTIIDADFPGSGTTGVGMGHIVVLDDSPTELTLCARSRDLWGQIVQQLPEDCEDERCGTLWLATSDDELAVARSKREVYRRFGVESSVLDEKELAMHEPALRRGLAGALFVPDDRVLYAPAVTRSFVEQASRLGTTVRERTRVISMDGGKVVVRTPTGSVETVMTGAVVNAAGIDAPRLTPGLPIIPRKGHLVITDRYPGLCRSELVELGYLQSAHSLAGASIAFNLQPRATGQVLIGSSRELVGERPGINRSLLRAMIRRAIGFVPALAECSAIRAWTGFRPATPDGLPLIGRWEATDGLWIAGGHEGLGITLAPVTAEMIVAGILGRKPALDPTPFSPTRSMPAAHAVGVGEAS
jgi:glycine/D-amino acid oxidase-like deaminating enzyme